MKRIIAFLLTVCLVFGNALPSYAAAFDHIQQTVTPEETVASDGITTPEETSTPAEITTPEETGAPEKITTPEETIVPDEGDVPVEPVISEESIDACGTVTPEEVPVVTPEAPAKPAGLKAASSRYDRITLTWQKAAGADTYEIYRSTKAAKGFRRIATVSGSKLTFTDKKLTCGTTYYYKIRATATYGSSTLRSAFTAVKKAAPLPNTPVIKASYKNYSTATLKWNKISGANGYYIYRSTKKNSGYKKIATIKRGSTLSYTDKKLATGSTYYYKIRAYRTVKKSAVSGKLSTAASVKLTLKAPTLASVSAKDYRSMTIKWKKVSGADGYYIYRSTKANGTYTRVGSVKGASKLTYVNQGVTTGKKYYYQVKAYRVVNGKKVTSSFSNAKAKATSLKKVSGITATPLHANKIQLKWTKVAGAASYNIYRSTKKTGTYTLVKRGVKDTAYTNSKLTNSTRYYYQITAVRGSYESGKSGSVTTKAASLDISQTSVVVQKRFSVSVSATPHPGGTVKWSTSNPGVATVSSDGVIYGVNVGTATITAKANGVTRTISVKVRQTLDGIDVSKWQGPIDFTAVKNAGYHFVMIRIYNGVEKDPNFETYYRDAIAAGLSVGVYYYSYATSVDAASADASTVLSILNGRTLHYPVVIDMEDNRQLAGLSNQDRTNIARAFCNIIATSGYQTGLYANTYWLDHYFENSQLADMNLWIARWTQDISIPHGYTGSGNIFMWQYTSNGTVPGINGRVDLNVGFSD